MSDRTKIEYVDATWNPIRGCDMTLPCAGPCWARRIANRQKSIPGYGGFVGDHGEWTGQVALVESQLKIPLSWRAPRRIAVALMGDLFHPALPDSVRDQVFAVEALCPQHEFLHLTKRAREMWDYISALTSKPGFNVVLPSGEDRSVLLPKSDRWPLPNVRLGISAEDQPRFQERNEYLMRLAAGGWRTLVSLEPLLGPVILSPEFLTHRQQVWCIVGGESGPGARPMVPEWPRAIRDQCVAAGVPYFHKQNGEWAPVREVSLREIHHEDVAVGDGTHHRMFRVGKKAAGRLLDGREWNEMAEARRVREPEAKC